MPRICFVTCLTWPDISASDRLAQEALERRRASVVVRPWNAPDADFGGFDAVILRSNWDYHRAPDQFLTWLDTWEAGGARIWNPPALIRWNLAKRYLLELEAAGIPIVPTVILDEAEPEAIAASMAGRG